MPADATIPWQRLSEFVADRMGLNFPMERLADLQRGLASVATEFGFPTAASCANWILSSTLTRQEVHAIAGHLTVGETYFFRESKAFDVLAETVLPRLIQSRRSHGRRLRIWSAACCTGEEPYSLAILLHRVLPDLADWHVTILATDINERFLQKAVAGIYGDWSFREAPSWVRDDYFTRTRAGSYAIRPEVKAQVKFANSNLVEDAFPSLVTDTNGMDLILCRNVLMYFTLPQMQKVIRNLHSSLVEDGWLVVSACETSSALFTQFSPVNFPGAILYQRRTQHAPAVPALTMPFENDCGSLPSPWSPTRLAESRFESAEIPEPELTPVSREKAAALFAQGSFAEATEALPAATPDSLRQYGLLARSQANEGKLSAALGSCDRWVAADKLNAPAHYLRAVILQELGDFTEARASLQRAVYLQPDLVLAHFSLGNVARTMKRFEQADKHFANALKLLGRLRADELLPESDGLTAGRLTEIIASLLAMELNL